MSRRPGPSPLRRACLAGVTAALAIGLGGAGPARLAGAASSGRPPRAHSAPRPSAPSGAGAGAAATTGTLLALGDSLAAGYQPSDGRKMPPVDPATGLPDQGYPGGYAADLASREHLRLVDLACPGETTVSFTATPAQRPCGRYYAQVTGAGSQLAAAIAYLGSHKGAVRLVTIDLGANDVDGCMTRSGPSLTCLAEHATAAGHRLAGSLRRLEAALRADDPSARLAGMTYYDPFLALAYDPGGLRGLAEATLSLGAVDAFNKLLTGDYRSVGATVAGVAGAFASGTVRPLQRFRGSLLPRDVAAVCRLTWMCPDPAGHTAADIHPNRAGYARIAAAFVAALHR